MTGAKEKARAKQKAVNPLVHGIQRFIESSTAYNVKSNDDNDPVTAVLKPADLPKRYTIYEPMLLLGPTFPSQTAAWTAFYSSLSEPQKQQLFQTIVTTFCDAGQNITHIALNAPIAPSTASDALEENVMRSPTHLQPLHGDFGPDHLLSPSSVQPIQADFDAAFWVEASQVSGIKQVWAPRWTMFSRGNIREKARILGVTQLNPAQFPGLSDEELGQDVGGVDVVDFFVGIGYFALPYLRRGVRRVFGWDINGWSVEGLRRGCERNGVGCEVASVPDGDLSDGEIPGVVDQALVAILNRDVGCIAFCGDNAQASVVMEKVRFSLKDSEWPVNIRHCNLGLLPTSADSWRGAVDVLDSVRGGWLHVHENAEIVHVEQKKQGVIHTIDALVRELKGRDWQVVCEHVEMVKTYAPGVGHFVFDIKLWPAR